MQTWLVWILIAFVVGLFNRRKLAEGWRFARSDPWAWSRQWWKEWGEPLLIAGAIALVIRTFALGPYKIPTGSMRPTLLEGDRIFVDKLSYRFRLPARGEIIVFKFPGDPKKDFVKRLIAFGGEEVVIRDGLVFVDGTRLDELADIPSRYYYNQREWKYGKEGQLIHVPEGSFFVLGDNSAQSSDSRKWGFVPESYLVGRAFVIWWPFTRLGFLR